MEKKLVSRIGAFVFALLLLFVSPTSIWAENVTPADGCWKTVKGDGYLIKASATDAGNYTARIEIENASSTEDLTKKALEAIANKHVTDYSCLYIYGWNKDIKVNKAVLKALKDKNMSFDVVAAGEYDWCADTRWSISLVENCISDFNPVVTTNVSDDGINRRLVDAGITWKTEQFTINGTGVLPGKSSVVFSIPTNKFDLEAAHNHTDVFVYYYNASKNVFELQTGFISTYYRSNEYGDWEGSGYNDARVCLFGGCIEKCGTYLISDEPLPDAMTTGKTVTVDTTGITSTKTLEDAIIEGITSADKGSIVSVAIPAGTIVTENIFEEASKNGVKLTITSSSGTYVSWAYGEIKNPVKFDPTVYVGTASKDVEQKLESVTLPASLRYTPVHFAFEGNLPGEAEVTLDLSGYGKFEEGSTLYLYYYNPTTKLFEKVDSSSFCNGFATFKMTHCSDYIITNEELTGELVEVAASTSNQADGVTSTTANTTTNLKASPKTGDAANVADCLALLFVGALLMSACFYKRKRV